MNTDFDIVIHGAGIPGLALALSVFAGSGAARPRVLLIDRSELIPDPAVEQQPTSVEDFDTRVFALTYASKRLLEEINAWPGDNALRVYPYEHMHVWDAGGSGQVHFDAAEIGTPSLGFIVEARAIHAWLIHAVRQQSAIEMLTGDELKQVHEVQDALELNLSSGKTISTQLLIGADGAKSHVRQLAGIDVIGWPYHQQAIVATVSTEQGHDATAWQRFLPEGPLAFLPMQKPWSSIVWTVAEQHADELSRMAEDEFFSRLGEAFQYRLGEIKAVGPRQSFPLKLSHATTYIGQRVALVADAAHTVHPLAGQGLNLGLLDVVALSRQLRQAWNAQQDLGSRRVLRAYERSRKGDNWLMQLSFDGFKRLFSNELGVPGYLRNTGLNMVDRINPVKNAFVRKAMGL